MTTAQARSRWSSDLGSEVRFADFFARGVVWDIDGTLIDSEPLHLEALLAISREHGCSISKEENEALLGLSLEVVWEYLRQHHGLGAPKAKWMKLVTKYYLARVQPAMARPGAVQCVRYLATRGVPQACVSTADRQVVDGNLEALGVSRFMLFSVSREDVKLTKPDPEPYRTVCQRLGLEPGECLAIEDTVVGVRSASHAGLTTVAWPHGMSPRQTNVGATYTITGLSEVPWHSLPSNRARGGT